ncbi:unnamed protein product [Adineta steineri]|uniref:Uncharacterized protein n=1 Tax=Adineta steineri TaxID=433720 RepID=A0A815K0P0_9BILA|nr:unnamed protein product [Adineta steineri]CAF1610291.1 unnamed protein product [Adineta steineri]
MNINITINGFIDNLIIEQLNLFTIYENYSRECRPAKCTSTYESRNDAIYIMITVVGLIRDLLTVLKLITSRFVKLFPRFFLRKNRNFRSIITVLEKTFTEF